MSSTTMAPPVTEAAVKTSKAFSSPDKRATTTSTASDHRPSGESNEEGQETATTGERQTEHIPTTVSNLAEQSK